MKKTLSTLMHNEHKRINSFLQQFEEMLNRDFEKAKEIFGKFNWNLEKHFYVEEKVIFTVYNSPGNEESENLSRVIKEHKDITWMIKKIKENLDQGIKIDLTELKQILKIHEKFEDEVFYSRLEDELSQNEKELIIERANEIIRG